MWAQAKWEATSKNKTFKISDMQRLANEELDKVTQADWASCVHHTVKLWKMVMQNFDVTKF
jgi:hypothetical protein